VSKASIGFWSIWWFLIAGDFVAKWHRLRCLYWKEEYVALLEKRAREADSGSHGDGVESSLKKVASFGGDGDPKIGDTLAASLKEI
jgi:hypothetical protein